jgi:hypothetical protein
MANLDAEISISSPILKNKFIGNYSTRHSTHRIIIIFISYGNARKLPSKITQQQHS